MRERRWIEPASGAPKRLRAALRDFDAEPSAQSRARGWARFSAEATRRKTKAPILGPLAMGAFLGAALVAAVFISNRTRPTRPAQPHLTAVELEGSVFGVKGALTAGARLEAPTRVRVASGGRAVLRTANGDIIRIGEGAEIHLPVREKTYIDLSSGAVDVEASPRFGRDRLVVVAGSWRVEVVGTRFSVDRDARGRVQVAVQEGKVRVVGPGYDGLLGPGESFDSSPPPRADMKPAAPPASARAPAPRTRASRTVGRREEPVGPTASPAPERTRRRSEPLGEGAATSPPERSMASAAPEWTAPRRADSQGAGSGPRRRPPAGSPILVSRPRAQVEEVEARRPERPKDAGNGEDPPDSAFGQVAAYRAARALKDAGRSREAAERYAELIARWPRGELSQVAYLDEIECLLAANDVDGARRTERSFVEAHPTAASRPEASFMRAEVARALGEHRQAAALYAAAATADRFAEAAGFLEALSHARAGATSKARDAMRTYLRRFPNGAHAAEAKRALRKNEQ